MFVQAFDALKIPENRFGTRDTLKKVICSSISRAFFLLFCHFHMNLNIQNSWSNSVSTYHWQFSTGNHFHVKWLTNPSLRVTSILPTATVSLCAPPWSISNARLFFEVSTSIFCALIWPRQSFHTICFRICTSPVMWSILEIAVLRPPQLVSIVQSFLKASSSSSRVRVRPL